MMKSRLIFLLLFCCHLLSAEEPLVVVEAAEAHYDGKKINLTGDVLFEHALGKMAAQQIVVSSLTENKRTRLDAIDLLGHVQIKLSAGGELTCEKAFLDYRELKGQFEGSVRGKPEGYVIYNENGNGRIPFLLQSRRMAVQLAREIKHKNRPGSISYLSRVEAEQDVSIDFNHDFMARSDIATYQRQQMETDSSKTTNFPGIISLKALDPQGQCQVTNRNGDVIDAAKICINTSTKEICFAYPKGVLHPNRDDPQAEKLEFKADTLFWNDEKSELTLRDHVTVAQKGLGELATDHEIRLKQALVQNKKQLKTIESTGLTTLKRTDDKKNIEHHLTCHGKMTLDHVRMQLHMESPVNEFGKVNEDEQVKFEDPMGVIQADSLTLEYELDKNNIIPIKLILIGNVKMLNSYAADPSKQSSPLVQYALADKVEYDPQTKEAVFFSIGKGRRVLFYDKTNDLQVSAPGLKIKRDEVTHKDSIKGICDVRFCFIENEFDQLRQRFLLDKLKNKENP
jgi:hypothetical protein